MIDICIESNGDRGCHVSPDRHIDMRARAVEEYVPALGRNDSVVPKARTKQEIVSF